MKTNRNREFIDRVPCGERFFLIALEKTVGSVLGLVAVARHAHIPAVSADLGPLESVSTFAGPWKIDGRDCGSVVAKVDS